MTVVAGYLEDTDPDSESMLVGGVDHSALAVEDSYANLNQLEDSSATAERLTYSAERIATDSEEFAEKMLEESGAELPPVSDDVDWLLTAVQAEDDHRLSICRTDIDDSANEAKIERQREAVDELQAMIRDLEADTEMPDNISYVYYSGQWYRLSIGETAV